MSDNNILSTADASIVSQILELQARGIMGREGNQEMQQTLSRSLGNFTPEQVQEFTQFQQAYRTAWERYENQSITGESPAARQPTTQDRSRGR
jgi:hypothetical protein